MNTVTFTERYGESPQGEWTVPIERIRAVHVWHDTSNGLVSIEGRDVPVSITKEDSVKIRDALRASGEPEPEAQESVSGFAVAAIAMIREIAGSSPSCDANVMKSAAKSFVSRMDLHIDYLKRTRGES